MQRVGERAQQLAHFGAGVGGSELLGQRQGLLGALGEVLGLVGLVLGVHLRAFDICAKCCLMAAGASDVLGSKGVVSGPLTPPSKEPEGRAAGCSPSVCGCSLLSVILTLLLL